ncbi:MAG: phosphoribosylformylglycinamidine synthase subunit PurS [Meiothermus sp.]|uniref:phosphoribosylformylglycinamidine synthase subunit PurS n=1 Tax=Meiothermus sp. TaxID=1955249 RepID=UPI0025F47BA6|nr:phosphoribosylformylglycinamidine synthase subunit PurS [Meiothermus sp.]MCS7195352.1 phosphoribosylformylglycinamidine synthase subunit PurS [Meiothermus sp.]MCX7741037.1 phosphoribosylformylglycinamidine synthase subunit PurS [Meiothermus sp.]MDW8090246.1 phosphoribosylformylglycinamidine synthase subunit PurS [Meiothermus sp.]
MRYHLTLLIELKDGILDPQGRAVEGVLQGLGFRVEGVRVGRVLEMEVEARDEAEARAVAQRIGQALANPVMEVFVVEAVKELV